MKRLLASLLLLLALATPSFADDINAAFTADNYLGIWLSTSYDDLGTWLHNSDQRDGPPDWVSPEVGTINLNPGVTNYLHICAWGDGYTASGLIGGMTLNNPDFQFANGQASITTSTNTNHWSARNWHAYDPYTGYIEPTLLTMVDEGGNGAEPWCWGVGGGAFGEIDPSARWVWTNEDGAGDLSAQRIFTTAITPVAPEPVSSALFLLGGGSLALLRRKKAKS